ncbi:MAG TPA: phosphoribosylformylglycinamidine synthase subunit PurQ [Candidatus Dormibacteraeota bacterium]
MRFGIAVFPGTWSDRDWAHAVSLDGHEAVMLWHKEADLRGADCVILPGGFSYGDHLRCGAIARFAPLMAVVADFAREGGLVLGSCNGFQILCEAHLLPGALLRNESLEFRCQPQALRVETTATPFTAGCAVGELLSMPVAHGEGRYVADVATLDELEAQDRVIFRYAPARDQRAAGASPNGSQRDIAGIVNGARNVLGMMPHPERACEPLLGSSDGLRLIRSVVAALDARGAVAV